MVVSFDLMVKIRSEVEGGSYSDAPKSNGLAFKGAPDGEKESQMTLATAMTVNMISFCVVGYFDLNALMWPITEAPLRGYRKLKLASPVIVEEQFVT